MLLNISLRLGKLIRLYFKVSSVADGRYETYLPEQLNKEGYVARSVC